MYFSFAQCFYFVLLWSLYNMLSNKDLRSNLLQDCSSLSEFWGLTTRGSCRRRHDRHSCWCWYLWAGRIRHNWSSYYTGCGSNRQPPHTSRGLSCTDLHSVKWPGGGVIDVLPSVAVEKIKVAVINMKYFILTSSIELGQTATVRSVFVR